MTDKLTGIYNRLAFDILFKQIIKDVKRKKIDFSIILFDIDNFKYINDKYGHLAGDKILQEISSLISINIREVDIFCRWGGEEFLILLKSCDLQNAYIMAEKIRELVKKKKFSFKDNKIFITISLGITQYEVNDNEDKILTRVDNLLYQAKTKGRNKSEK